MTRAEAVLIEWARAEQTVDEKLEAWRAEIGDDLPPSRAAWAENLPSWRALRAAGDASEAAYRRVREVAQELLDAQQPAGYAAARLKPGAEY